MNKYRVLVADDMEILVKTVINELNTFEELEVIGTANDGEEEYSKILELKPDIVFTDNQMPKMAGWQVIEKANEEIALEERPLFVMITSDRFSPDLTAKSRKYHFLLIPKPITTEGIQYAIDEYLYYNENREKYTEDFVIEEKKEDTKQKSSFFSKLFKKGE